jgi:hypothetical protein
MSESREDLARRKELLLARSSVYRLALAVEAQALRESLSPRRLAATVPLRAVLVAAAALIVGRGRIVKLAGWATRALMLVKLVRTVREVATHGRR